MEKNYDDNLSQLLKNMYWELVESNKLDPFKIEVEEFIENWYNDFKAIMYGE